MKLIIVHYHCRPGGIRRIIEVATPHLLRESGLAFDSVTLASGEANDATWNQYYRDQLAPVPVEFFLEPGFHYLSEQPVSAEKVRAKVRRGLDRLLSGTAGNTALVWAHNLGIGRNLILTRELQLACARREIPLVCHHHDWWFDNRWLRWPEMQRFGFKTLSSAAAAVFSGVDVARQVAINHVDAHRLESHFPKRAGWLPNLTEPPHSPNEAMVSAAREWLKRRLNDREAPVWILPCRLLRRKNVAEALLLTRWLRPEAWLVTTGGISSTDEEAYARKLGQAAHQHHWRLRLSVLEGAERGPNVAELLRASEAVLLTSIQEGFGLPYLEATAAERPLVARSISNIAGDLEQFGFQFPQYYEEILVDPGLFDWAAERRRQLAMFSKWRKRLPHACWRWVGRPVMLRRGIEPVPVPFSRLTLTAQLEILAAPVARSWKLCEPLNPFLSIWKERAQNRELQVTPWPAEAEKWLGGRAYARRFGELVRRRSLKNLEASRPLAVQRDFMRERLSSGNLFPILWSRES